MRLILALGGNYRHRHVLSTCFTHSGSIVAHFIRCTIVRVDTLMNNFLFSNYCDIIQKVVLYIHFLLIYSLHKINIYSLSYGHLKFKRFSYAVMQKV